MPDSESRGLSADEMNAAMEIAREQRERREGLERELAAARRSLAHKDHRWDAMRHQRDDLRKAVLQAVAHLVRWREAPDHDEQDVIDALEILKATDEKFPGGFDHVCDTSIVVAPEKVCEQCKEKPATNHEWGPSLCEDCATATAQGDGR